MKSLRSALLATVLLAAPFATHPALAQTAAPAAAAAQSEHDKLFALFAKSDEDSLARNPLSALFRGDTRYADRLGDYLTPEYNNAERKAAQAGLHALAARADDLAAGRGPAALHPAQRPLALGRGGAAGGVPDDRDQMTAGRMQQSPGSSPGSGFSPTSVFRPPATTPRPSRRSCTGTRSASSARARARIRPRRRRGRGPRGRGRAGGGGLGAWRREYAKSGSHGRPVDPRSRA